MPHWPFISTSRLRLRPATMADLPAIETGLADPRFPPDLPLARMQRESTLAAWLQRITATAPQLWAITVTGCDTCIGTVALIATQAAQTCWLSYWLTPSEWHQGLAQEAIGALLTSTAQHSAYKHVIAGVALNNLPSIRLLEQLKFTPVPASQTDWIIPAEHILLQRWLSASLESRTVPH